MNVVISTVGRFHLFALARELEKRKYLRRIYSGFIWTALARENVPRNKVTTFPWFRTPYMALNWPSTFAGWLEVWSYMAQDLFVARHLPECDIFVGHDGVGLLTGRVAQRRGARYFCDTGVSHIKFRNEILREEFASYGAAVPRNTRIYERQIEEYETADAITVGSTFAKESFIRQSIPADKVHVVPYGVRTEYFHPVSKPPDDSFRVLFVGNLSIRKGARYLLKAFRDFPHPAKELAIAGTIAQEVKPVIASHSGLNIKLLGHVPHTALRQLYSSSHAFVLPSIEDGFGMVMGEALACGCPVIASVNTGAKDLFAHGLEGFIVPIRNSSAIRDCLTRIADEPELRHRMSAAAIVRIRELGGWNAYGDRYAKLLEAHVRQTATPSRTERGGRAGQVFVG